MHAVQAPEALGLCHTQHSLWDKHRTCPTPAGAEAMCNRAGRRVWCSPARASTMCSTVLAPASLGSVLNDPRWTASHTAPILTTLCMRPHTVWVPDLLQQATDPVCWGGVYASKSSPWISPVPFIQPVGANESDTPALTSHGK